MYKTDFSSTLTPPWTWMLVETKRITVNASNQNRLWSYCYKYDEVRWTCIYFSGILYKISGGKISPVPLSCHSCFLIKFMGIILGCCQICCDLYFKSEAIPAMIAIESSHICSHDFAFCIERSNYAFSLMEVTLDQTLLINLLKSSKIDKQVVT